MTIPGNGESSTVLHTVLVLTDSGNQLSSKQLGYFCKVNPKLNLMYINLQVQYNNYIFCQ